MGTINSTQDNCVIHNILSNAAMLPGYNSPVEKLTKFVNELPQQTINQYYSKSKKILDSGKYTNEQFANFFNTHIDEVVNNSANATEFSRRLFAVLDTM
jgi:hypothetical protein